MTLLSLTQCHFPENLSSSASYITLLYDLTISWYDSTMFLLRFKVQWFFTVSGVAIYFYFCCILEIVAVTRKMIILPEETGHVLVPCVFS